MRTELRHCADCGGERPFEVPFCSDGHGADCPERVCVDCGSALVVDPPPPTDSSHGTVEHAA